jgi:phosphate transport system substrate-binding protein
MACKLPFHAIYRRLIIAVLLVLSFPIASASAATIVVGGTGSGLGVMRLLGLAFARANPGDKVEVLPSLGSNGGIRALEDGALAVAIVSRAVKDAERKEFSVYDLGCSPFVFAVHSAVAEEAITLSQVAAIYSGKMTVWQDGTPIRRILRPVDESDWRLMQGLSPAMADALQKAENTDGLFIAMTDADVADYLEESRGSFGPVTLTLFLSEKRRFKILSLDGVRPDVGAVARHRYPVVKPYTLLIRHDATEPVKRFMRFIQSGDGRQLLQQSGIFGNMSITHK